MGSLGWMGQARGYFVVARDIVIMIIWGTVLVELRIMGPE